MQSYLGLWERETHQDIRRLLQQVRWFIDIGAGGGELCLLFKKAGTNIVIAAEPQSSEEALLRENLAANGLRLSEVKIITKFIDTMPDWRPC
jgi:predicted RNA methylase